MDNQDNDYKRRAIIEIKNSKSTRNVFVDVTTQRSKAASGHCVIVNANQHDRIDDLTIMCHVLEVRLQHGITSKYYRSYIEIPAKSQCNPIEIQLRSDRNHIEITVPSRPEHVCIRTPSRDEKACGTGDNQVP